MVLVAVGRYTAGLLKHNRGIKKNHIIIHWGQIQLTFNSFASTLNKNMNMVNYSHKKHGKLSIFKGGTYKIILWNLKVAIHSLIAFPEAACICKHWIKSNILQLGNKVDIILAGFYMNSWFWSGCSKGTNLQYSTVKTNHHRSVKLRYILCMWALSTDIFCCPQVILGSLQCCTSWASKAQWWRRLS